MYNKPVEIVRDALLDSTGPGDVVLDLLVGSGTTLLAAEMEGRKCRAIELEPLYCDVTIERWEAFTGQQGRLAATGGSFAMVRSERAASARAAGRREHLPARLRRCARARDRGVAREAGANRARGRADCADDQSGSAGFG